MVGLRRAQAMCRRESTNGHRLYQSRGEAEGSGEVFLPSRFGRGIRTGRPAFRRHPRRVFDRHAEARGEPESVDQALHAPLVDPVIDGLAPASQAALEAPCLRSCGSGGLRDRWWTGESIVATPFAVKVDARLLGRSGGVWCLGWSLRCKLLCPAQGSIKFPSTVKCWSESSPR